MASESCLWTRFGLCVRHNLAPSLSCPRQESQWGFQVMGTLIYLLNSLFGYAIPPKVLHKKGMSLRNALTITAYWPYLMTRVIKLFVL